METIIPAYDLGIDFSRIKNIYLAQKPADLRKGIDGYASMVQHCLGLNPTDGSLYLFVNRQKNKMKGVIHDGNGYWLIYKRIPRSHLSWPTSSESEDYIRISADQLKSLLSGLAVVPTPAFFPKRPRYV